MFNFPIGWIVLENVCLNNFNIIFFNDFPLLSNDGLSYCHIVADVIATYWWCQLLADVVPMTMGYNHWCYDWLYGWCYCQYCIWLMLLPIMFEGIPFRFLWMMDISGNNIIHRNLNGIPSNIIGNNISQMQYWQ